MVRMASRYFSCVRAVAMTLCCVFAAPLLAQHATGSDVFSGEQAFQNFCANCHGKAGNQIANVDLGHGTFRKPYRDDELQDIVMKGIPGTAMPATPAMSAEQATQIVAYLRSRALSNDAGAGGDAQRGAALFAGKGQCFTCHRVNGEGSRRGPDLSRIGTVRTSDQLATSLLDPNNEVQPGNRYYGITTRDGARIEGRLLNRDVFSVQLLDTSEQLRSFARAGLRSEGFIPSPMPSVRGLFNDQEVADIVKYLTTLRGPEKK